MDDDKSLIANDGGFSSRKLWFSVFSTVMILVASKLAHEGLGEIVTGIVSVCAIYIGGNTVVKWRAGGVEQARNTMPGVMGKIVAKAADLAEAKDAKAVAKADAKEEAKSETAPDVIEAVDDGK